jgi:hypothetical protein
MNRMVYNPASGIYEQSNEFPDMYNSNPMSARNNDGSGGNTCIGGNMAFSPGYQGYNVAAGRKENAAAVKLQQQSVNARQDAAQRERERYVQKEANTAKLAKVAEQNYKSSAQCTYLKEAVKADQMLASMKNKK